MRAIRGIAIVIMLVGYLIARGMIGSLGLGEDWLVGWAVCAILMFFIILIHEAGHAVVAWWLGGQIHAIIVFPLQLDMRSRRLGFASMRRSGDVGGYVSYRLDRIDARRKHMMIAAAGPVANLATATLVIGLMTATPERILAGLSGAIGSAFIVLSLGIGLANLLPFDESDGARIVRGLRSA